MESGERFGQRAWVGVSGLAVAAIAVLGAVFAWRVIDILAPAWTDRVTRAIGSGPQWLLRSARAAMVALALGGVVIVVVTVLPTGRSGVITGHIYLEEGLTGPNGPPTIGGLVTVVGQSGRVVAHERVHDGKPFHFVLPSGEYELQVRHACSSQTDAVVRPGETTVVNIDEVCGIV
jgi:hypothetical protein